MLHQRDAVGLVTHDTQGAARSSRRKASSKHLLHVLRTLEQTEPGGETSMAPLWHDLAGQIKRRGLVVILSDCFDQLPALMRALQHFRHRGTRCCCSTSSRRRRWSSRSRSGRSSATWKWPATSCSSIRSGCARST